MLPFRLSIFDASACVHSAVAVFVCVCARFSLMSLSSFAASLPLPFHPLFLGPCSEVVCVLLLHRVKLRGYGVFRNQTISHWMLHILSVEFVHC